MTNKSAKFHPVPVPEIIEYGQSGLMHSSANEIARLPEAASYQGLDDERAIREAFNLTEEPLEIRAMMVLAIFIALDNDDRAATAADLVTEARRSGKEPIATTVAYRMIDKLLSNGLIAKSDLNKDSDRPAQGYRPTAEARRVLKSQLLAVEELKNAKQLKAA